MKENFDKMKKEYLAKLRAQDNLKDKLIDTYIEQGLDREAEAIIDPKDEFELQYANTVVDIYFDTMYVLAGVGMESIDTIPCKGNPVVEDIIRKIKCLMKNGYAPRLDYSSTEEEQAKMLFYHLTFPCIDFEECAEYVMEQVGLDSENEDDIDKFDLYMKIVIREMKNNKVDGENITRLSELTQEKLDNLTSYAETLHSLVEKYCVIDDTIMNYANMLVKEARTR